MGQTSKRKMTSDEWEAFAEDGIRPDWWETEKAIEEPSSAKDEKPKKKSPKTYAQERWMLINNFIVNSASQLKRSEMLVWLMLFRNSREGTVAMSQRNIAKLTGIRVDNINIAIKGLKQKGLVKVVHQGGYRHGMSRYRLRGRIQ